MDETDFFDEQIYDHMSMSLRRYVALKAQEHTVGPGWPMIVSLACQTLGGRAEIGRLPSVFFGTAAILAIFFLVYYVFQANLLNRAFWPASFAALLTAISIPQIEFSQRMYPYATIPFLTTLIVIFHLMIVRAFQSDKLSIEKFSILAFLYALISGFSIFIQMGFSIVIGGSFLVLLLLARRLLKLNRQDRVIIVGISALALLSIFLAWIGNAIHLPQSGYRPYLAPYYHQFDFGAIFFLLTRAYDVFTYHLNLFYNGALYWPRNLNPALLPLVGICIFGWIYATSGKLGQSAKHLSLLAIVYLILVAVLSLLRKYPFGGVRQTLLMAPFLISFTAMGFYTLIQSRKLKMIGVAVAAVYLVLWAVNLPHFYKERIIPFDSRELLTVWEQNGKLKVYTLSASKDYIRYRLHKYPEIKIENLPYPLSIDQPFLLVSPWWAIEDDLWLPRLQEQIKKSGSNVNLVMKRPAKYPAKPEYIQSLYFPPNGLWVYKISIDEKPGK